MSATSPSFTSILVEQRGAVTVITINRPEKLNAINRAILEEIGRAVHAFVADDTQGALVLTGAGEKAFVAGADIAELQPLGPLAAEDISRFGQSVMDQLEQSPKPTIAAVNGFALGGGCELALGCHVRLVSENAQFGLPEVGLGIIPGYGGTVRLPRLVGQGRALEMVLTGRRVKADEAVAIGLANRIVPRETLLAEAIQLAEVMLKNGPLAMQAAIESVVRGGSLPLAEALRFESGRFGVVAATEDMHEGLQAFLEKRPARFRRR